MTRNAAVSGIASNNPIPPQIHPQNNSATVMDKAFNRTLLPTKAGASKLFDSV
jgi:hypothetical protein